MYAIGIDIGGMSMKWGLVSTKGAVVFTDSIISDPNDTPESNIIRLVHAINESLVAYEVSKDQILGVGVGCAGTINAKEGVVTFAGNLNWDHFPLAQTISEEIGLPCKIGNDANVAALGEVKFGAGKKYQNAVLLTLGTGVGGGVIINGEIFEGNEGAGAELGHMVIKYDSDIRCTCGLYGCLEVYASATALIRQTKAAMLKHKESTMWNYAEGDINNVKGKTVWDAYNNDHDATATEVVNNYIKYLSIGIMNFNNIFRPEAFILSGGIAKQGDTLTNLIKEECAKHDYGFKHSPVPDIIIAELGYDSGVIGAASLLF